MRNLLVKGLCFQRSTISELTQMTVTNGRKITTKQGISNVKFREINVRDFQGFIFFVVPQIHSSQNPQPLFMVKSDDKMPEIQIQLKI